MGLASTTLRIGASKRVGTINFMTENITGAWPTEWRFDLPEDDWITPEQAFDILFGYAEERHRNDPCARPEPKPKN